jgi:hypothetical protein
VTATLLAGDSLVIDTRPGSQSVRRGDGTSLMNALGTDPALWPLLDGVVNSVSCQLTGATSASSHLRHLPSPLRGRLRGPLMARSTYTREQLAVKYSQLGLYAQLCTGDPGTTGANTTGSRVAITWTVGASDGVVSGTASITVAAGVTVTHAALFDAASAGNYIDGGALPASYTGAGTYSLTITETEN